MSALFSLFTSDPFLVRCELERVRKHVEVGADSDVLGTGSFEDDVVLLKHYGAGVPRTDLWDAPETDAVLMQSGPLPPGTSLEENAQPFRLRQWLFAHSGKIERPDAVRDRLMSVLPEFLQRMVRGSTVAESIFATFLAQLRHLGRMEDMKLEAPLAAQLLIKTARLVEQASSEAGIAGRPGLQLIATNGRLMVAARRSPDPLHYKLLEGEAVCARCGLEPGGKDSEPLVREHRLCRSVVFASNIKNGGWLELADGSAVAVDRRLSVQVMAG